MGAPKKYVKIDGVMRLNPEYKKWKEAQSGGAPATSVSNSEQALPIVTNMDDYEQFNDVNAASGGALVPLSESTNATIEMMQEPEISLAAGMAPDDMVDDLGAILNKYEVPMGLMNKLMMLSEFEALEFIVDDSGSMSQYTDALNAHGKIQTRWQEAEMRLKELLEILAYVPFNAIAIIFLNRPTSVVLTRQGRDPVTFLANAVAQVTQAFSRGPTGSTPAFEKIEQSCRHNAGKSIARYFFCDGIPNGGPVSIKKITQLLCNRQSPAENPITFFSCTNEDADVEWMKDVEEVAPYCAELDDFEDEKREVMRDQGDAFPFSRGFYLICSLCAAMNPDDLDCMDESVPFTKATLDNLLGIVHDQQSYRHYFNCFLEAQGKRIVNSRCDQAKKSVNWDSHYQEFLTAPMARDIPAVESFKSHLKQACM
eukprot:CAMPEP_0172490802 /NCGR_PEP_ID=MMETSP1066-20121228/21364_1 /TAXON_ID=671091 /ORGANISM="Coscinodiscus wailesii, Strain CCMP2513" /LENGTH=425 /DNA_ID=CAMNT_0013259453 /DNA_START=49 /DNA_END=1326 /DNA_ORIENTATION=-